MRITDSDVFAIGEPGWNLADIAAQWEKFKSVYRQAPVLDNAGGMKAPHAFASWFMLKSLQPRTIIESGVWKGQGTWLFEQACPDARIISLDVNFSNLEYRSPNADYVQSDFSLVDFLDTDKRSAICFFDDHQDQFQRLLQMRWKGFATAIFEDNYPPNRGDCYSMRKILGGHGFQPEKASPKGWRSSVRTLVEQRLRIEGRGIVPASDTHRKEVINALDLYYEFPPLFKEEKTRWGDEWDDTRYPTKPPIFGSDFTDDLRSEALHYTWICLVRLK